MEMGHSRTRHGALGRFAVSVRPSLSMCGGVCLLAALAGCNSSTASSAGPLGGAAVGLGVAGITANPFVAYAAGVGAQAAITSLQKYLSRKVQQGEQDNIASTVGNLQPGQYAPWKISYVLPVENEHGDVTVIQSINTPLTECKEVAFTVVAGNKPDAARAVYITSACAESDGVWKWAEAEPAAARWGFLQ